MAKKVKKAKVNKPERFPFENNFNNWLCNNGKSIKSANSYCIYINSLNKKFFRPLSKFGISALDAYTGNTLEDYKIWESILMQYLGLLIEEAPKYGFSSKTVSNYQSAFFKYIFFLDINKYYYCKKFAIEVKPYDGNVSDYLNNGLTDFSCSPLTFSKDVLLNNFSWRLSTQNRLTGPDNKLRLPFGLISKIFNKLKEPGEKNYLDDEWALKCAKKILIYIQNDNVSSIQLGSIISLRINPANGEVTVKTKRGIFDVLSPTSDKSGYKKFIAYKLKDLHIDHKEAIDHILKDNSKTTQLKTLQTLTDWLFQASKELGLKLNNDNKSEIFNHVLKLHPKNELLLLEQGLKTELEKIGSDKWQTLQLMEAKENSQASNKC